MFDNPGQFDIGDCIFFQMLMEISMFDIPGQFDIRD